MHEGKPLAQDMHDGKPLGQNMQEGKPHCVHNVHAIEGQSRDVFLAEGTVHTSCSYAMTMVVQCDTQHAQCTTGEHS